LGAVEFFDLAVKGIENFVTGKTIIAEEKPVVRQLFEGVRIVCTTNV